MSVSEFSKIVSAMCAPSTVAEPAHEAPTEDERTALIAEGQDLAYKTQDARWRVALAPFNKFEGERLGQFQALFGLWYGKATKLGIDVPAVLKGFDIKNLVPFAAPPEPDLPKQWNWGFFPVSQTPPAPKPIKERRPYGACSAPGLE